MYMIFVLCQREKTINQAANKQLRDLDKHLSNSFATTVDNKTYDSTGAEEVWCATVRSDLDKRQCTVQLTIFVDSSVLPNF